jgi:hypothetical protein
MKGSLSEFQRREAFTEKRKDDDNKFRAALGVDSKFLHRAFVPIFV